MSNKTIKLESGEWPISEVLPDHWADHFRHGSPPSPNEPRREVEIDGGTEKLPLDNDDPLMIAYYAEVEEFNRIGRDFELLMAFRDVAVPVDWTLPEGVLLTGLPAAPTNDKRAHKLQFIRYHIITAKNEPDIVSAAANGIITGEERAAGAVKFPSPPGDEKEQVDAAGADTPGAEQAVGSAGE